MYDALPVKFVLYSHYGYNHREDLKEYEANSALSDRKQYIAQLKGVRFLKEHFRGLKELLTTPGHHGLLVLFYAPGSGFESFLHGIAAGKDTNQLLNECADLAFARDVAEHVNTELRDVRLDDHVRFITPLDLEVILGRVNAILRQEFPRYIVGRTPGIRYDTPKIPEAILRLRVLGNGVPVLRLDHDVIFREENKDTRDTGDLGLFKAIACSLRAYHLRLAEPTVSTFLFSASYDSRALLSTAKNVDIFQAWSRAFATRVYPTVAAEHKTVTDIWKKRKECEETAKNLSSKTEKTAKEESNKAWYEYAETHLDESLLRQFYGLTRDPNRLKVNGVNGLTSIGAHPLFAVISGALLCLSEGAILDLPPFSNFRHNVMWIDDHLKYALHRAMHHFTSVDTLVLEPGLSDARLDNVMVTKQRPKVSDMPSYVFGSYLPTLLLGTIMDTWIAVDPILKCRLASLRGQAESAWQGAKRRESQAALPRAMLQALQAGEFGGIHEQELETELLKSALTRIESVRQLWGALCNSRKETFASYWARGEVQDKFPQEMFSNCTGPWQGIAPGRPMNQPVEHLSDLQDRLQHMVRDLCDDAVTYVHWTLKWPTFVQIVRSIRQGDFAGDLSWQPGGRA